MSDELFWALAAERKAGGPTPLADNYRREDRTVELAYLLMHELALSSGYDCFRDVGQPGAKHKEVPGPPGRSNLGSSLKSRKRRGQSVRETFAL